MQVPSAVDGTQARTIGPTPGTEVLIATDLHESFRHGAWPRRQRRLVLRGASLFLHPGEVVGLVGEIGSGKSTLMKILVGALAADEGNVRRSGRLGYGPQEPTVYARLTCDEHFELFGVDDLPSAVAESQPAPEGDEQ